MCLGCSNRSSRSRSGIRLADAEWPGPGGSALVRVPAAMARTQGRTILPGGPVRSRFCDHRGRAYRGIAIWITIWTIRT